MGILDFPQAIKIEWNIHETLPYQWLSAHGYKISQTLQVKFFS